MIYYASAAIVMLALLIGFVFFLRDLRWIWQEYPPPAPIEEAKDSDDDE